MRGIIGTRPFSSYRIMRTLSFSRELHCHGLREIRWCFKALFLFLKPGSQTRSWPALRLRSHILGSGLAYPSWPPSVLSKNATMFVELLSSLSEKRKENSLQNSLELSLRLQSPYFCLIFAVFLFSSTFFVLAHAMDRTPILLKIVTKLLEILLTCASIIPYTFFRRLSATYE